MPITLFPFAGGINGQVDTRLLPDGALTQAVNVELDREGRLVGRAGFTAQPTSTFEGDALLAYDLFSLNDRLFAIAGLANSPSGRLPFDIFEFMGDGLARQWRATSTPLSLSPRLPRATAVRDIARPPDQPGGVSNMGSAAGSGFVAVVWNSSADATRGFVFITRAVTNQPVIFELLDAGSSHPCQKLRALALSDRFLVLGLSSAGTAVSLARWTIASDIGINQVATALLSGGAISTYAACKVAGSDEFCVVANIAGTVTLKRFSNLGVNQAPSGGAYGTVSAAATALAVEASSAANQISIAMVVGGEARLFSYNLATGASIGSGPFVPFSGETSVEVSLARKSATVVQVLSSVTSEPAPTIMTNLYTVATNAFAGVVRAVTDAQLTTSAVVSSEGYTFCGVRFGAGSLGGTPNALMGLLSSSAFDNVPQIVKDLEVAGTVSSLLPDLTEDASTSKYYWTNATANPDGELTPFVTEFELDSTERRQIAQFGNLAYIAGGVPLVFDGVTACESGFLERPRIISLTPSNGAGALLSGATYDFRAHFEWIDSDLNLHVSPPSAITPVTLGASDDTVTGLVTSAHSLRRNRTIVSGGHRVVLSRTLATIDNEPATVLGTLTANPPGSSLNGLDLTGQLFVGGSVLNFAVTFGAGDTSSTAIAATFNAALGTTVHATDEGGFIRLTTVSDVGDGVFLYVFATGAGAILGFSTDVFGQGTTTRTVGENFQRAAVAATGALDAVAAYVTVTDLRKDQSDPIVDSDLIRQQVLYSEGVASGAHHAPPPSDCVWASKERIGFFRQPRRSQWTVSKLIVPGEPAECAFAGVANYSGQVTGDIEAGAFLGEALVLFTRRQIWIVAGSGPNRAGTGEFFQAQALSHGVGLIAEGWRSLVDDETGLWFQGSDTQLYRMTLSGVTWLGKEVQDYLDLYPVVTAALYVRSKREVAFACQSADGSAGGILRYRSEAKAWFFDDVGPVASMADYQGRVALVQAGVVYIQDAAPGVGTFVPYRARSGMFQGFQAVGYGQLHQVGFLGTYRGPCTIEIFGSPDGNDFSTSLGSWTLTGADYAVGDRVVLLVQPSLMERDSFALELRVTGGSNSEGLWLHAYAVDTEKAPGFARLGANNNL